MKKPYHINANMALYYECQRYAQTEQDLTVRPAKAKFLKKLASYWLRGEGIDSKRQTR